MRIRSVAAGDSAEVADVYIAALTGMTYLSRVYSEAENRAFVENVLLRYNEVWVAEEAGTVIGFVGFGESSLRHLWVKPGDQNQGIGTALLEVAKKRSPDGLKLSVFQQNHGARRFYERHGFTLAELRDGTQNIEGEADAIYEWRGLSDASQ
jgi:ribosomal protein S18 acetylase RimI-like enzyme